MSKFLDICPTHKDNYITCGPCLETASSVWLFQQDNHKLKRDLRHLKTITADLEEKLSRLESNLELIKNSSQPDSKQSLKDYLLSLQIPTNFFSIIRDHELSISFLLQTKVLESEKKCGCGKEMTLTFCSVDQEYFFICECNKTKGLLQGSIWEDTALSQDKILLYLFLWAMNLGDKEISQFLYIKSAAQKMIDEKLKKIVSEHFLRTLPKFRGIVEIDESCFRSGHGPLAFGQTAPEKWVFGLYERDSKRVYMEVVPKRTAEYLLPIIKKRCEIGTTIISDQWAAYNKLPEIGFPHYTVDHSRFFVNPHSREIHTQHIEISWCWAKYNIKRKSKKITNLQDSLNVFCWKRQYKNYNKIIEVGDIMKALFELIKEYQEKMKMKKIPECEVIVC